MKKPVADCRGELVPVISRDQGDHHVEPRDSARAGESVVVELEQRSRDLHGGKGLTEGGNVFPVQRAAASGEQAGLCKDKRSAGQAANYRTVTRKLAQPGKRRSIFERRSIAS